MFLGGFTAEEESILKKVFLMLNFMVICSGTHAFI